MENNQFRQLLLMLCESLDDSDIPHQTKVRTAIMDRLAIHFEKITEELQVCLVQ